MAVGNMQMAKACGICSVVGHPTDMCPTLQEEPIEQVNAASGFPRQPQRKYDPYSSTYNPGWRDHSNLSYGNPQVNQPETQNHPSYQQYKQPYPLDNNRAKLLILETRANIQILDNQMGQMATAISQLKAQSLGKLPSHTVVNPRENASAIVLRSDKEVETPALAESRKDEQNKDLYETFRRCEVNIPLLDAIKQVPHYAKFLKEMCNTRFENAMTNLGASINVMPYSIYASLKLGPLNKTSVVIQLINRSIAYPKGVVEDVLVQINDLVFPTNFYVFDMENGGQTAPILLRRPFLKTSKTKVDVHSGTLAMKFDGEIEVFELDGKDGLEVAISKHLEKENEELALSTDLQETVATLNDFPKLQQSGNVLYIVLPISNERPLPSVLQAPIPDLKPLPNYLKYMFLGDERTLPVIISNKLSAPQEEKLVQALKEHKTAIVEIQSLATSKVFKVNGHRLTTFYEGFQVENVAKLDLEDPIFTD
ncbi:uncharacterized protein LOC133873296 [Alnus glutinosa]|uniref:uncharacterized protein LOC133873296 n=1 Tax=Alnus glutinosa TaxID=3517 RepID=UPI002D78C94E|nr:uncharacterized protein LOC133873296 [Alnus glutinosa]